MTVTERLDARAEAIRCSEIDRRRADLDLLDDEARDEVEAMTRRLVEALLADPRRALAGADADAARAAARILDLDDEALP